MLKKYLSLIFIFLVVSFPVSAMHARVYGESELPNFSKGVNDHLVFEVYIDPSEGHEVSLSELSIYFPFFQNEIFFNQNFCKEAYCENINDPGLPPKKCKCVSDWGTDIPMQMVFRYNENNNHNIDSSVSVNFYPDYKKPTFTKLDLFQENNGFKIDYRVRDEACNTCNNNICSGIKEVLVSDSSGIIAEIEIDSTNCFVDRTDFIEYSNEGEITFDFIVRDRLWQSLSDFNHQSTTSKSLILDFSSPQISNNFEVYKNNKKLTYISEQGIQDATVSFIVEDDNLDKISAKLSNLGNNNDIILSSYDNHCNEISTNKFNCSFNNVNIINQIVQLEVKAVDIRNNEAERLLNSNLILDNFKPYIEFIGTSGNYNGQSYVKNGENTFIVVINEPNSGISKENVRLNINAFGHGNNIEADECVFENNQWICSWKRNLNVEDENSYTISLGSLRDNAGNSFDSNSVTSTTLIADTQNPKIDEIDIYVIGEWGIRHHYQSNDRIIIDAYIEKEGSPLKEAFVDVSELFVGDNHIIQGNCNLVDDIKYLCSWETNQINQGYYLARLKFEFIDSALNVKKVDKRITVYGILSNIPDNFQVNVKENEMIPRAINRLVATLQPSPPGYKILVPFNLRSVTGEIRLLHYDIRNCGLIVDGDFDEGSYGRLFQEGHSRTPDSVPLLKSTNESNNLLEFTMGNLLEGINHASNINELNGFEISCQINIFQSQRIQSGYYTFQYPEVKNLTFEIDVTGEALDGEPGEKVIEDIKDRMSWLVEHGQFITETTKVFQKLESWCNYAKTIIGAWASLGAIESLGASLRATEISIVKDLGTLLYYTGCFLYEGMGATVAKVYYGNRYMEGSFSPKRCWNEKKLSDEGSLSGSEGVLTGQQDEKLSFTEAFKQWGDGRGLPGLRNICGFVTCEYSTVLTDWIHEATGGNVEIPQIGDETSGWRHLNSFIRVPRNVQQFEAKNSIIMSAASYCLPGVLYNLHKYRQIECDYLICLRDVASQGGPTSICKNQKSQNYCLVFFGELYETVSIIRLFDSMGDVIRSVSVDLIPTALSGIYDNVVCDKKGNPDNEAWFDAVISITCTLPRAWYNLVDSYDRARGIKDGLTDLDRWKFQRTGEIEDSCRIVRSDDFIEGLYDDDDD